MTPKSAHRLFAELTNAEIAYRIRGVPVATFCRWRASRYLGEVRRELNRVADLGPEANRFMSFFLDEFQDDYEP